MTDVTCLLEERSHRAALSMVTLKTSEEIIGEAVEDVASICSLPPIIPAEPAATIVAIGPDGNPLRK